jgi:hypothetical protein
LRSAARANRAEHFTAPAPQPIEPPGNLRRAPDRDLRVPPDADYRHAAGAGARLQAYNQGISAVRNGTRAPVYLDRFTQSLNKVRALKNGALKNG